MAAFPRDCRIRISKLIKLWIAEGFLRPTRTKSLEDVAMEYIDALIDRNLIIVSARGTTGKIKSCTVHDLLRDFCIQELRKENFLCVTMLNDIHIPPCIESKRRLSIQGKKALPYYSSPEDDKCNLQVFNALRSASFIRSLVCGSEWMSPSLVPCLKLLRVLDVVDIYSLEEIMLLINSRYLSFNTDNWDSFSSLTSSVSLLWNLQTLIVHDRIILPPDIWKMRQLRHLKFQEVIFPDPPQVHALRLIQLMEFEISDSVVNSVKQMKEERESLGYEGLQVQLHTWGGVKYY
ncbi:UNVERIFIED_CONTAM: putative late blight resistance proteinR1A-10 [Sesamum calycinum]|uniref:Late blight resistance proteinR1A-10 n=1 Tax=Sesamum calycinum TaxID=2727403 RepID=A0AAW2J0R6_9LAMI